MSVPGFLGTTVLLDREPRRRRARCVLYDGAERSSGESAALTVHFPLTRYKVGTGNFYEGRGQTPRVQNPYSAPTADGREGRPIRAGRASSIRLIPEIAARLRVRPSH